MKRWTTCMMVAGAAIGLVSVVGTAVYAERYCYAEMEKWELELKEVTVDDREVQDLADYEELDFEVRESLNSDLEFVVTDHTIPKQESINFVQGDISVEPYNDDGEE